ncbi:MAG: hypothetical protein AAB696_01545 [Patescibacteria group bacterium]
MDIIQAILNFFNYAASWFDQNIASGIAGFLKSIGELIIKILEIIIEIIKWLISYL